MNVPVRSVPADDVDAFYRRKRLSVMISITLGYGLYYTCRLGLAVMKKPLIDGGIFSADELGQLGSALFYAYAAGKLFNGFLSDHLHVKWFFPTGLALSALMNLLMGTTTFYWVWMAVLALNGWFQGFGAAGSAVALSAWFSNNERGRYYGIWSTAHAIGEGLTYVLTSAVVSYLGWRSGFYAPGLICLLAAIPLYFGLENRPDTLGLPPVAEWRNDPPPAKQLEGTTGQLQFQILRLAPIWVLGLASAGMYVTRYGINSWGMLYLQEAKGYSLKEAGALLGINTVAGILGSVAYGFVSDKWFGARRAPANLLFAVLELAALGVFFFSPPSHPYWVGAAICFYGFSLSGILASVGGLFAIDIAPKRVAGAAMGFIGVFSYLGAAMQEQVSGKLIQQGTTIVEGVRHYDFSSVILFWIGGSVVSLFLAASLWRVRAT